MLALFASAFVLGLVFNAAPGAVFAETVRRGVRGGFRPAFAVQVGSLIGDASWALLGLMGIGVLLQVDGLKVPIALAGAAYLSWLAWDSWRAASKAFEVDTAEPQAAGSAFRSGAVLSLTNPQNVAYWAALGGAMGAVGVSSPTQGDYLVFFGGFMASSVLWCFVCAAAIDRVFRRTGQRWVRLTYRLCAALFLALAIGTVRDLFAAGIERDARPTTVIVGER